MNGENTDREIKQSNIWDTRLYSAQCMAGAADGESAQFGDNRRKRGFLV